MKTGTCYFPSYGAALRYYRPYCVAREHRRGDRTQVVRLVVDQKLNEGAIHIGKPAIKPGETLTIEDNRYHITDTPAIARASSTAHKSSEFNPSAQIATDFVYIALNSLDK